MSFDIQVNEIVSSFYGGPVKSNKLQLKKNGKNHKKQTKQNGSVFGRQLCDGPASDVNCTVKKKEKKKRRRRRQL